MARYNKTTKPIVRSLHNIKIHGSFLTGELTVDYLRTIGIHRRRRPQKCRQYQTRRNSEHLGERRAVELVKKLFFTHYNDYYYFIIFCIHRCCDCSSVQYLCSILIREAVLNCPLHDDGLFLCHIRFVRITIIMYTHTTRELTHTHGFELIKRVFL